MALLDTDQTEYYNMMSITKGIIGFLYGITPEIDTSEYLLEGRGVRLTVHAALCHATGLSDDGTFLYDDYRQQCRTVNSVDYALTLMPWNELRPGVFAYNNIVWHLLSYHYQIKTGRSCTQALERLIGPEDWKWETALPAQSGEAPISLGPHGLYMKHTAIARLLPHLKRWLCSLGQKYIFEGTTVPAWHWPALNVEYRQAYYGWWWYHPSIEGYIDNPKQTWAHGYYAQFLYVNLDDDVLKYQLEKGDKAYEEVPIRYNFIANEIAKSLEKSQYFY